MSYILDALRKSEQERRQVDAFAPAPGLTEAIELPQRRVAPWVVTVGLTVLFAGVAGGFFLLRQPDRIASQSNIAEVPKVTTAVPPVSAADSPRAESVVPAPLEVKPRPPLDSARTRFEGRDLAAEAQSELRKSNPAVARARTETAAPATAAETKLVMAAPANEPVKYLNAMPSEFRHGLPELSVNIHIYAPREADRILYINNHQYHTGDRVRDDIVVEAIVEDGAVLSYHGQRFKLPRPQ
ncbi:MAG: general secretion pathway protein GspB [Sulfurifustaceae bacterium]